MDRFISAARAAVEDKNWYGALALSLTLPDICGRLEDPRKSTKSRYVGWWEKYCQHEYTSYLGPNKEKHVFLSGDDAYALRCAYLHEGGADITEQKARKVLQDFILLEPIEGCSIHLNQINSVLQLQVDQFCSDICNGAQAWLQDHKDNPDVKERMTLLLTVHKLGSSVSF
ncbi:hypothetical protein PCC82_04800 [Agrobacterium deltaense]